MNDFYTIIKQNSYLDDVIKIASSEQIEKFYIGAGAVTQTIWNFIFGYELTYGIDDIDIVYFNNDDLSELAEDIVIKVLSQKLKHIPFHMDIKNQARTHLWYKDKFGYDVLAVSSIKDAIDRWPTTATSIGLRINRDNDMEIYAPFGLDDLFSGTVRANKRQITSEIYDRKVQKWIRKWPNLKIIPWN
jgi:uncharacterized protein